MITDKIPWPAEYEYGGKIPSPGYEPPLHPNWRDTLREKIKAEGGYKAAAQRLGISEKGLRDAANGSELVPAFREVLTIFLRST